MLQPSATPEIVDRVARCLYEHPHDTTVDALALRLVTVDPQDVRAALDALCAGNLALTAGGHWQLSGRGFRALGGAAL